MRKLSLDLDALQVASFETTGGHGGRGTVRGREDESGAGDYFDCTCAASCDCPSAYYRCNTNPVNTHYSCTYTQNESCPYTKICPPTS
ncbi:MAG TPA: hypothetical protein VF746_29985 [Longimicrobium sp.]|jgi:hypothetical protein